MARAYIDAAASKNPDMAAGAVVFKDEGTTLEFTTFLGEMDNHEAEWAVLAFAVDKALEHSLNSLIVHTDSKVIADSFDRNHVKNPVFKKYFDQISQHLDKFDLFIVSWTPRGSNRRADELAKETLYRNRKG
ncbi:MULTISPECIES: ribonuclease HI family protein [Salinicoccus]|uniref:ribonuclease HI family protein n=1 Tax=Salinicoccus TaxID=45669 RepID=UPI0004E20AD5|nr:MULTISPECIES: ribonuclease HI family protein [Salinicoccus]RPE54066.1 RNase HI [Salinicoccus roseus]GGA68586.1 ribonuclease H [Salinicoccus roseus]